VISVLIVDDHPIVRRGLKEILTAELQLSVEESADPHDALRSIREGHFDLVVLDLDLPGMNGLELLKEIKRENDRIHVLVLSVYPEDQFAVRVINAGAAGFISKDAAPEELVSAVKKILRGKRHVSERVADLLLERLNSKTDAPAHERLSDREFQILGMFGEGKTVKQIAQELSLSAPTVSTYRARILNKMDMKSTAELVKYAIQYGISGPK